MANGGRVPVWDAAVRLLHWLLAGLVLFDYFIDDEGLKRLEGEGQVVFRYLQNPNGSRADIAGIVNSSGNVLGMMPHPERNAEPLLGNADGRRVLASFLH